jgi:threonine aldolase
MKHRRPAQRHRHAADRRDARRDVRAPLGDDVFGDDPTVNALQERIAAMLGKEAALFVPSGTQSNLVAMMSHCQRGDEYIVGQMAHTYRWEGGGAAVLGSVQPQPLEHQPDGTLALADIEAAIKPDDAHFARSRLLCLENTLGGKVLPMAYLADATALARKRGLATHLDGARLFNARRSRSAAARRGARDIAQLSTASRSASRKAWARRSARRCRLEGAHRRAHRWRKMLGGGMRQAGVLAAAASACARPPRRRAWPTTTRSRKRLAEGLAGMPGLRRRAAADQHRVRRPRRRAREDAAAST